MQPFCSPLFLHLTLVLLLLPVLLLSHATLAEAKKKTQPPASRSAVPGSGELTTKAGHSCTWATSDASDGAVALQVSCSVPGGEAPADTYQCRFTGKPELCPAYADKANQYWKQVVGKLKKRSDACEGEKVLKTRLCKKAPAASHVRLAERSGEEKKMEEKEEEVAAAAEEEEEVPRGKETAPAPVAKEAVVAARRSEREGKPEPLLGDAGGFGEVNDGTADSEVSNYCAEGWHSLCSFFVKFFDG
ncbi:fibroblast growth factor-binding protein 3 [Sardina pilchardus]|uniref:fibroblast growth factor-binding protein 3 n=1 Tax=Sardina pilchardus TaxID=27697 RepID=UPI002E1541D1